MQPGSSCSWPQRLNLTNQKLNIIGDVHLFSEYCQIFLFVLLLKYFRCINNDRLIMYAGGRGLYHFELLIWTHDTQVASLDAIATVLCPIVTAFSDI